MLDAKLVRQSRYGVLLIHEQDPRPAASRHYEPGTRTGVWLKVKNVHRQEFVIGAGYEGRDAAADSVWSSSPTTRTTRSFRLVASAPA